ncbi:MAG TPA: hypothetical protein VF332_13400 [Vicinamibacterales bacterium]
MAAVLILAAIEPWHRANAAAGAEVRLPGAAAPQLGRIFTPRHVPDGAYDVKVLKEGIEGAMRLVMEALAPEARPGEPSGTWQVQHLDPLEAFGTAGVYDRSKVARLYAGRRVSVVRGPVERDGRVVAAVTLISPYPDPTLSRLEPGTLAIMLRESDP